MYTKHLEERTKIEKNNKAIPEKNKSERKMNGITSEKLEKEKRKHLETEHGKSFCLVRLAFH